MNNFNNEENQTNQVPLVPKVLDFTEEEVQIPVDAEIIPRPRGNPNWIKGISGNGMGKPAAKEKLLTNRQLREKAFLELVRKFRPHVSKAVLAAVKIVDSPESADQNKLRASALLITTYKDLIKETYDYRYDEGENEAMQDDNQPIFSLKVVNGDAPK